MNYKIIYSDELYHHGVKGMKWGVRKQYQPIGRRRSSSVNSSVMRGATSSPKAKVSAGIAAAAKSVKISAAESKQKAEISAADKDMKEASRKLLEIEKEIDDIYSSGRGGVDDEHEELLYEKEMQYLQQYNMALSKKLSYDTEYVKAHKRLNEIVDEWDRLEEKGYMPGDPEWDSLEAEYEKHHRQVNISIGKAAVDA